MRVFRQFLSLFFLSVIATLAISAQTTAFTYQGRLNDGAVAANGTYQMQFLLYDALSGGAQQGSTITNNSVTVTNGVFAVQLDFSPATPFATGANRWIEIAVRKAADPPGFTILAPRRQVTSSPYAIRSLTADNATQLGGVPASGYLPVTGGTISGSLNVSGTINGNGSGLTNLPGFPWQEVTGTSVQAVPNHGYFANNAGSLVTVTLPASPNVGDIIRITGAAMGGWAVVPNSGQTIIRRGIPSLSIWTPHESSRTWSSVASSADGTKLVAVVQVGQIYTSTDSGATWTARASLQNWVSVASSADGTKLVAGTDDGRIFTSTNSGVAWTQRIQLVQVSSVASSADGTKLIAGDPTLGPYTSNDSGLTWTFRGPVFDGYFVAISADGTKLAGTKIGGRIYTSTDSGVTWTPHDSIRNWGSIAISADGTNLVASVGGGLIYTSIDSGVIWIPRDSIRIWQSVAISADGTKLAALEFGGRIYSSTAAGLTWLPSESNRNWQSVAISADGLRLAAVESGGRIYTAAFTTSADVVVDSVSGGILFNVELQYVGSGKFIVIGDVVNSY